MCVYNVFEQLNKMNLVQENAGRMSDCRKVVRNRCPGTLLSRFVIMFLLISNLQGLKAVKIVNMVVPELIQYGTQDSIILDCDYTYGNYTSGLVVKWFFKNKSRPVYQWIPTKKPQDLGILRGKVDLGFKVSDDKLKMHRAMRIINPGTEVSGDYTCVVSTFMAEDQQTKNLMVFAPESNFRLHQNKSIDQSEVSVICSADGMYPAPNLTISTPYRSLDEASHTLRLVDGRYTASTMVTLKDEDLPTPTVFICTLRIPQAKYIIRKEAIYYPGPMSTTPDLPTAADMQSASGVEINKCCCGLHIACLILTATKLTTFFLM